MSDGRLRRAERRWRETGSADDLERLRAEERRAGERCTALVRSDGRPAPADVVREMLLEWGIRRRSGFAVGSTEDVLAQDYAFALGVPARLLWKGAARRMAMRDVKVLLDHWIEAVGWPRRPDL